jgi:PKD repeat protein
MKSDVDPGQLPLGYYWSGVNVINIGGMISCRPGYRCLVTFPQGNLQGCSIFRQQIGLEQMMVAIDGVIYVSEWPFLEFRILPNVQFSPYAKQIYWQLTVQSANRLNGSFSSPIEVIAPKTVMFMQDGGSTAPAWYDGSQSAHIRGNDFETPAGGPMMWVGDRLWIGKGNQVFASDIANPFSFREQIYLGGTTSFFFEGEVTALVKTPSIESPQLMVFTETNASILQASLRNRDLWPTTDGFQKEILQIGCTSSRGVISHYGRIVWMAAQGMIFFDPATSGKITTRMPIRDNEMLVSKITLNEDLSLTAIGAFGQYLCVSVPAEDLFNKHTWVLNHASLETLSDDSGPSWAGYWLGTRPVEWAFGEIAGAERIFHVSADADGNNRLWEAFRPDRLDNGCPIMWAFESRGYFGQTTQAQKVPGSRCRMAWTDLGLAGIAEDLNLGVFYAPGVRGAYQPILNKLISVQKGSIISGQDIEATSQLFAFKPQSRVVRTEDANQQSTENETGSCGIERADNENIDESFQLLVVGHGPATVRWVRPFALAVPEDFNGDPAACIDEVPFNTVRFDGSGVRSEDLSVAAQELALKALADYTSNKTVIVEQGGISAVGVGFSESVVSQEAADRVAEIIAVKQAESELRRDLPPVISVGAGFDPDPEPTPPTPPPAVVAAFTGSPTAGGNPLSVTFFNSSQNASNFLWNFGDGNTSTQQSPVHVFTAPGSYTVTLTVTGPNGGDTTTKEAYITVVGGSTVTVCNTAQTFTCAHTPFDSATVPAGTFCEVLTNPTQAQIDVKQIELNDQALSLAQTEVICCPALSGTVVITDASPDTNVGLGAEWKDGTPIPITLKGGQATNIYIGNVTTYFGFATTLTDSGGGVLYQDNAATGDAGVGFSVTVPTNGNYFIVFSAFQPGIMGHPDTSVAYFTNCEVNDVPCSLPGGLDTKKYRIVGYADGLFDVSGCAEPPSGNPAWDGSFLPESPGDWEADDSNFPTNFSVSGVLLGEGIINYINCSPVSGDGQRVATWRLSVYTGSDFAGGWLGVKTTGASPAGVYTRFGGCIPGPATITLEEF